MVNKALNFHPANVRSLRSSSLDTANRFPANWHFIWTLSIFCSCTTNLERITAWAETVQYNTSVFQVSPEDTLLPPSAPHSRVAPPIAFLRRSLRALNKFMPDTDDGFDAYWHPPIGVMVASARAGASNQNFSSAPENPTSHASTFQESE